MTERNLPKELSAEHLMEYIRHVSVVIGPRHPTGRTERTAAAYVHSVLHNVDPSWEINNQPFRSVDSFRYRIAPLAVLTGLSLLLGLRKDRQSQLVGGLLSVGTSVLTRDAFLARPAVWETWMPRGEAENVIVRIPPRHRTKRRVVFVAHLDSGVHRVTAHPKFVQQLPRTLGGTTLLALTGGVLTALSGKKQRWRGLRTLIAGLAFGAAGLAVVDEMGPDVSGANGDASGIAVLLGLGETLRRHPLDSTEVVLAFTGAATAVSTGADILATAYGEAWADALWVVVNNVGTGELCWVTRHGISPYAYYYPHPDAVRVMERVASARPDLGMMGSDLLTVDEVANLRDRDLRAVALMAYDRVTGLIPNWRQTSDTVHEIDPATVERAAYALWTAAQVVDQADTWPFSD